MNAENIQDVHGAGCTATHVFRYVSCEEFRHDEALSKALHCIQEQVVQSSKLPLHAFCLQVQMQRYPNEYYQRARCRLVNPVTQCIGKDCGNYICVHV